MFKAYHRRGPDRANQKVPFSSAFGLRSGEKYRISFTLSSDYLQVHA